VILVDEAAEPVAAADRLRVVGLAARLAWRAGKAHDDSGLSFTDDWWEKATPVDWSPEQKQGYLLALWDEVLTGIDAIWARAVAARAADA
jgi:hypothetical protein